MSSLTVLPIEILIKIFIHDASNHASMSEVAANHPYISEVASLNDFVDLHVLSRRMRKIASDIRRLRFLASSYPAVLVVSPPTHRIVRYELKLPAYWAVPRMTAIMAYINRIEHTATCVGK